MKKDGPKEDEVSKKRSFGPIERAQQARCLACGHEGLKLNLAAEKGLVARCPACGLIRTIDNLSPKKLAALYDKAYLDDQPAAPPEKDESAWRRPLDLALKRQPPPARFLEIGVGQGWLLKAAGQAGYDCRGADVSAAGAARAEQVSGAPVAAGSIMDLDLGDHTWDVVCIRHVLEHLDRPVEFLERINELLTETGLLVGAVPNIDSLVSLIRGADWPFLSLPYHRVHFRRASLIKVLSRAGYRVEFIRTTDLVIYDQALFQVWLNRLRRKLGREEGPTGYDPRDITPDSLTARLLAREPTFHRLLAKLGLGQELLFAARPLRRRANAAD